MSGEIYAALAKMIAAVGVVGKTRKNAAQGYQFRGIDDVLSACQGVLSEHGVVCVPRVIEREREMIATKNGGSMASVRLLVDHTFYAKDGSFVVCTTLGEAMDSGDKASNKAMSAALKYALVETLCIPTHEDDRDTESASPVMAARVTPPRPPAESLSELRLAIETAPDRATLATLVPRLRARPEAERTLLRPAYEARERAVMP